MCKYESWFSAHLEVITTEKAKPVASLPNTDTTDPDELKASIWT